MSIFINLVYFLIVLYNLLRLIVTGKADLTEIIERLIFFVSAQYDFGGES